MKSKENTSLKSLLIALALCTFSACTDDELDNGQYTSTIGFTPTVSSEWLKGPSAEGRSAADTTATTTVTTIPLKGGAQPLYLHAVSEPIPDETRALSSSRGVTTATNGTLSGSIGVSAHINGTGWYMQNVEVTSASNWTTEYYWPGADKTMRFYAYTPFGAATVSRERTSDDPLPNYELIYRFTVKDKIDEQVDFMMADCQFDINGAYNQALNLTFKHVCTAIKFALATDVISGTIKSITVKNVKNKGSIIHAAGNWDWGFYTGDTEDEKITGSHTYTITLGEDGNGWDMTANAGKVITTDAQTLYMIPQPFGADATATIEVSIEDKDGNTILLTANLSGSTWTKGQMITYYISTSGIYADYEFEVHGDYNTATFQYNADEEGNNFYLVKSKKKNSNEYIDWDVVGYETSSDGGTTWTAANGAPDWLLSTKGINEAEYDPNLTEYKKFFPLVGAIVPEIDATYIEAFRSETLVGSAETPQDLSLQSGTHSSEKSNTANCYVVNAPGYYSFPLVYGNGLKDGESNTKAYNPGAAGNDYWAYYINHKNEKIQSPNIEGAKDAVLVWQDGYKLVTDVKLSDKKVTFKVNSEYLCDGNAVIAVRDENKAIMWSWHIWITHHDIGTNKAIPVQYVSETTFNNFMPYNLGWCEADTRTYKGRAVKLLIKQAVSGKTAEVIIKQNGKEKVTTSTGNNTFYQWGRKDPMRPAVYEVSTNGTNVDNNKTVYVDDVNYLPVFKGGLVEIGESIQNPHVFYYNNIPSVWNTKGIITNLWNAEVKGEYINDTQHKDTGKGKVYGVTKTIYDPCPVGYQMPTWNAFYHFTNGLGANNSPEWNDNMGTRVIASDGKGVQRIDFYRNNQNEIITFWPTGYRDHAGGTFSNPTYGYYWTAYSWDNNQSTNNDRFGCAFEFSYEGNENGKFMIRPWYYYSQHNRGCAVRPVVTPTEPTTE